MKSKYFDCRCFADEHVLRFTYEPDDPDDCELYAHVFLNDWLPWYRRLYRATKYVFGYKCKYGHWDCWLLDEENIDTLYTFLEELKIKRVTNESLD